MSSIESNPKASVGPLTELGFDRSTAGSIQQEQDKEVLQDLRCSDCMGNGGGAHSGNSSIRSEATQISSKTLLGGGSKNGRIEDRPDWAVARGESTPHKLLTLVIIYKDERVLLGMKKRGFGKGFYNGFGGKVEIGETIEEAAARELQEEAGVTAVNMSERGILMFHFDDNPVPWEVHVYVVSEFLGEPFETDEMAPKWFDVSEIPYDKMWSDDILWYPALLTGRQIMGNFYFENTTTLVSHSLQVT